MVARQFSLSEIERLRRDEATVDLQLGGAYGLETSVWYVKRATSTDKSGASGPVMAATSLETLTAYVVPSEVVQERVTAAGQSTPVGSWTFVCPDNQTIAPLTGDLLLDDALAPTQQYLVETVTHVPGAYIGTVRHV